MIRYVSALLLLISTTLNAFGQHNISGKVLDAVDKGALPGATVFLNNATNGTRANNDGSFILYNVKPGLYTLVVSMVGYQTYKYNVAVDGSVKIPAIYLEQKNNQLKDVKIVAKSKDNSLYLDAFKDELLGKSKFGRQCRLMNPDIVNITYNKARDILTASTNDFLIIENSAFGYRLKYLVDDFEKDNGNLTINYMGYVQFEEMQGSEQEKQEWLKNRREAYFGSLQHFFRALLAADINDVKGTGFQVTRMNRVPNPDRLPDSVIKRNVAMDNDRHTSEYWRNMQAMPKYLEILDNKPLEVAEFVHPTDQRGLYAMNIPDTNIFARYMYLKKPGAVGLYKYKNKQDTAKRITTLFVTYTDKPAPQPKRALTVKDVVKTSSPLHKWENIVILNKPYAMFDFNGSSADPADLKLEGFWALQRVGDLLPVDYDPAAGYMP